MQMNQYAVRPHYIDAFQITSDHLLARVENDNGLCLIAETIGGPYISFRCVTKVEVGGWIVQKGDYYTYLPDETFRAAYVVDGTM